MQRSFQVANDDFSGSCEEFMTFVNKQTARARLLVKIFRRMV
jgi:hypothetical protein